MSSSQGYRKPVGSGLCWYFLPGGKSRQWVLLGPDKAVGYALSYWQLGLLCSPSLAVLKVVCMSFRYGQAVFILVIQAVPGGVRAAAVLLLRAVEARRCGAQEAGRHVRGEPVHRGVGAVRVRARPGKHRRDTAPPDDVNRDVITVMAAT